MKAAKRLLFSTSIACILASCGGSDEPQETASAESCFDIATYSPGPVIKQQYDDTRSSPSRRNLLISIESTNAKFNEISGLLSYRERSDPIPPHPTEVGSSSKLFYLNQITDSEITTHARTSWFDGGPILSFENVFYSPVWTDKKFKLKQGESLKNSITADVATFSLESPGPVTKKTKIETEVVFEGRDAVAIGPRTVTACRFNYRTHREWFYRGILVKMDNGNGETILKTEELTRDGQPY